MSDAVSTACWKTVFEGVSCGSVTRPPPPQRGRKERKWSLIRTFFLALSANFFLLDCLLVAKVILMHWKYETSQTGRERMKYLTDAFLRK